jgi:hypothetical protein
MSDGRSHDLSRPDVLKRQEGIALAFRKKWNNLMVALCCAIWFSVGMPTTLNHLYPKWDSAIEHAAAVAAAMIISVAFLIYRMHDYKCPNCKNIPQGEYFSISGEMYYGKGINLIPKVCRSCGSFLSIRAIQKACVAKEP